MKKKSFFERLTGSHKIDDELEEEIDIEERKDDWMEEENEEGQLTVDVYQTPHHIIIKTMVAGVKPEDLDVSITQDMITIKGKREKDYHVEDEDCFYQELYWGSFSRSIVLPQEIDPDEAEATVKNGILTIKLPKLDKTKTKKLKVKAE